MSSLTHLGILEEKKLPFEGVCSCRGGGAPGCTYNMAARRTRGFPAVLFIGRMIGTLVDKFVLRSLNDVYCARADEPDCDLLCRSSSPRLRLLVMVVVVGFSIILYWQLNLPRASRMNVFMRLRF